MDSLYILIIVLVLTMVAGFIWLVTRKQDGGQNKKGMSYSSSADPQCPSTCTPNGTCDKAGYCRCNSGWTGYDCSWNIKNPTNLRGYSNQLVPDQLSDCINNGNCPQPDCLEGTFFNFDPNYSSLSCSCPFYDEQLKHYRLQEGRHHAKHDGKPQLNLYEQKLASGSVQQFGDFLPRYNNNA